VLVVATFVWPTPGGGSKALAQKREPPAEAVEFYRQGRDHYRSGDYREAIEDLERALMLDPGSATLVYNLARVHELLGELDQALEYYQHYLRLLPEGEDKERDRIEATIERLQGARAEFEAGETQPPEPPAQPPPQQIDRGAQYETSRGVADTAFWATVGGSGALLAAGLTLGGLALSRDGQAETFVVGEDGSVSDRNSLQSEADRLALGADLLLAGAAVGAVTATLLYALRSETHEVLPSETAALSIRPSRHGAVFSLRGTL
jgi:tetratricopeptide (TPR) repeat protein